MGLLKFRLNSKHLPIELSDLREAYITGMDRTPTHLELEFVDDLMSCRRDTHESGRLYVPWPIDGKGTLVVGTATLMEREQPYDLLVELTRGKLNDVRNMMADWKMSGLAVPDSIAPVLKVAQQHFYRSAVARESPETAAREAKAGLEAAVRAGTMLVDSYTDQVLSARLGTSEKIATKLAWSIEGDIRSPWVESLSASFNAARIDCGWKALSPRENEMNWEPFDRQLSWCEQHKFPFEAGPLIDLRSSSLPAWLYSWDGDYDAIHGAAIDVIRQTISRYKGRVPTWHLIHGPATCELLGMSEEDQIRITARSLQEARAIDGSARFVIGFERPWAEWMSSSRFQLGPLHLADYLARSDLGISGIGLDFAPGYNPPGTRLRDIMDFSKLLDLYALINLPLYVNLVFPSNSQPDPLADPEIDVARSDWLNGPDEAAQLRHGSEWISLAVAKPFVRSVTWSQTSDAAPHVFPHGGLLRPDGAPKPILDWIKTFVNKSLS